MLHTKKNNMVGFSSDPEKVNKLALQVMSKMQDHPRGDVVISLAVLWYLVCQKLDVAHSDTLTMAENVCQRYEKDPSIDYEQRKYFTALKEYINHDL